MRIQDIVEALEELAPKAYQESYDNAGLNVGDRNQKVKSILCTLDVTEAILDEAIEFDANMIVSHHPVIFKDVKSITGATYNERIIIKAIKNDIALYACHTNIDNLADGVNQKICEKLGLKNCKILPFFLPICSKLEK